MTTVRIATRASKLARVQAEWVASELKARAGVDAVLHLVSTEGDRDQVSTLSRMSTPGVFTREIEKSLFDGDADIAVHSMKDLPIENRAQGGVELIVAAVPEREDPRDAFVPATRCSGTVLATLSVGARVATSSPRRAAFLKRRRPDIEIVPIRGNVDTRLRKIDEGLADGLLCATAGLHRLGIVREMEFLPLENFPSAPAQGALAIQVSKKEIAAIVSILDHELSRRAAEAERKILAALGGGCHLALGTVAIPMYGTGLHGISVATDRTEEDRPGDNGYTERPVSGWRIIAAAEIDGRYRQCDVAGIDLEKLIDQAVEELR